MTRYPNRLPIGATPDSAPSEPPRYVPGRQSGATVKPLNCAPLSEACDTLPAMPALPLPRVVYRPRPQRHHSRLYWLAWDARWWLADQWDIMRYETGWIGQTVMLVLCAAAMMIGIAALLVALLLAGVR